MFRCIILISILQTWIVAAQEVSRVLQQDLAATVTNYGYTFETHTVVTEDGYILETFRVCKGSCSGKPVVFLQHGVFNTGQHFLLLDPPRSLGYILANTYDVWIGNSRGTTFSRRHKTLNPETDAQFWRFSFDEKGRYDLPANIDYILNATGRSQLYYVGHSEGTSSFYVMGSTRPEYNAKVKASISLSAVAYLKHINNPVFQLLAANVHLIEDLLAGLPLAAVYDLRIPNGLIAIFGQILCSDGALLTQPVCKQLLVSFAGYSTLELNKTTIPAILTITPSESSIFQVLHYIQLIRSGFFRRYDYGPTENLRRYNQPTPPNYDLGKVTCDTYLMVSRNDFFADLGEVQQLTSNQLGNLKGMYIVPDPLWAHNDFISGVNAKRFIYDRPKNLWFKMI
ncbi:lipase 3-like isoform X2 [Aethina tumida]|uniref:lipase 3-like isoform X2 n=1 Tax=Aethina tumida TaxID=116153 RepID=UPI002147A464|nr:lipase 3-like isoform X2 [Aethina tumida]